MQQQDALERVKGAQHQQVERPVVALGVELVEGLDQPGRDVPLETVLELEEFAEGGVVGEVGEGVVAPGPALVPDLVDGSLLLLGCGVMGREADLSQEAIDLLETLLGLGAIEGGQVIERDGQEVLHLEMWGFGRIGL